MDNYLPQKQKNRIFNRIKSFFTNLFIKHQETEDIVTTTIESKKKENDVDILKQYLCAEVVNKQNKEKATKKSIINIIEDKPELLQTMSIENLNNLTKLYDELIEENDKKIKLLKRKIS